MASVGFIWLEGRFFRQRQPGSEIVMSLASTVEQAMLQQKLELRVSGGSVSNISVTQIHIYDGAPSVCAFVLPLFKIIKIILHLASQVVPSTRKIP